MNTTKFWLAIIIAFTVFTLGSPFIGLYWVLRETFRFPLYMLNGYALIWNEVKQKLQ